MWMSLATPSEHPHVRGEDAVSGRLIVISRGTSPRSWGRPSPSLLNVMHRRNIPTSVGKTLKMLSKINHLTFSKVPNLLTFKSQPKHPKSSVFLLSLIRLSKNFVPSNLCRLERHPYTTQKSSGEKQHHENGKYVKPNV